MTYGIYKAAKDVVTGNAKYVSDEERQHRLMFCSNCPHFKKMTRQCGICGCFLDLKTKFTESECPDNPRRW